LKKTEFVIKNNRVTLIISILIAFSATLYLISLKVAYPLFQNTRLQNPLAEIYSLFPLYYLGLFLIVVSVLLVVIYKLNNKYVQFSIILLAAVMLWYTKYYLAGFSWEPDGPRNLGVALNIPQILNGFSFPASDYGAQYPVSYIIEYTIYNLSGMDTSIYLHLMPLINIIIFTSLIFGFLSKLFDSGVAFLATLLSILGMHYVIFIMGAHTMGMILLMCVLNLILYKGVKWVILSIIITLFVVISHPISPILLGIFLGSAALANISRKEFKPQIILVVLLGISMIGWFVWPKFPLISSSNPIPDMSYVAQDLQSKILPSDLSTFQRLVAGNSFLFPVISTLNRMVYFLYGLLAVAAIGLVFINAHRKQKSFRNWLLNLGGLTREQIWLVIAAPLLLIVSILMAESDPVLMERGLTLAIMAISGICVSIFYGIFMRAIVRYNTLKNALISLVLIILACVFPIISFSIDSYSSFPSSEESGLKFTGNYIKLDEKVLLGTSGAQITLFHPVIKNIVASFTQLSPENGDVFLIRSTGYYYASLRYDFSLEDNRITRLKQKLDTSSDFNSIYFNPTFSIYLKIN
jgi:hypothetical protein